MLLKECHDGSLAGHGGEERNTTFLKRSYYWPNLKDDAKEYVKTCFPQVWAMVNLMSPCLPMVRLCTKSAPTMH